MPWAQLAPLLLKILSPALVRKPRPTYRNRPNGLRPDLVQKLQAMNPKIFRFPGGNHVEGVATQVAFGGRNAQAASIEVRADPDPQAGNTLASPDAVVPSRGTLRGSSGTFTYQAPANSLTVIRVAR